jgi:hypothetical protein
MAGNRFVTHIIHDPESPLNGLWTLLDKERREGEVGPYGEYLVDVVVKDENGEPVLDDAGMLKTERLPIAHKKWGPVYEWVLKFNAREDRISIAEKLAKQAEKTRAAEAAKVADEDAETSTDSEPAGDAEQTPEVPVEVNAEEQEPTEVETPTEETTEEPVKTRRGRKAVAA